MGDQHPWFAASRSRRLVRKGTIIDGEEPGVLGLCDFIELLMKRSQTILKPQNRDDLLA